MPLSASGLISSIRGDQIETGILSVTRWDGLAGGFEAAACYDPTRQPWSPKGLKQGVRRPFWGVFRRFQAETSAFLSPDGLLAYKIPVSIWSPLIPAEWGIAPVCTGEVVWSPDSTRIAWNHQNDVEVWDVRSKGRHLFTYQEHTGAIASVEWSGDGRQITSQSEDGEEQVWDAHRGQTLATRIVPVSKRREWESLAERIREESALSPDRAFKAIPTSEGIEIRTVLRDDTVFVCNSHLSGKSARRRSYGVEALAWSPDGTCIAFTFDGQIYVWQAV
jgi:WD40 repeat protein